MKKLLVLFLAAALLGCSTVKSNDGNIVQIEFPPGTPASENLKTAVRSCTDAGRSDATLIRTVSTKPGMEWLLPNNLSTYRCN